MSVRVHVKKEDTVLVISGKDRGKRGRVLRVAPSDDKAFVEGVHFVKRHTRANPGKNIKGGIVEREAAIHVSKLKVVCPECKDPVRVRYSRLEDGRKVRTCRKCEGILDRN
jgi:large subunit ribosomal protein L24